MAKLDPRLMSMATAMARRLARRLPRSVLVEDLEQAALVGLLDALGRHPDGSGPSWEWYLRCRMRGAMLDELRRQDWSTRRRGGSRATTVVHLDDLVDGYGNPRQFATNDESPEETATRQVDADKAWATPLGNRDARIMRRVYERGILRKQVGEMEGISEARISQRVAHALHRMHSHLTGEPLPAVVPSRMPGSAR